MSRATGTLLLAALALPAPGRPQEAAPPPLELAHAALAELLRPRVLPMLAANGP